MADPRLVAGDERDPASLQLIPLMSTAVGENLHRLQPNGKLLEGEYCLSILDILGSKNYCFGIRF